MAFRKNKSTRETKDNSQSFRPGNPHRQELPPVQRQTWKQPQADPRLPGTSGYFNGIKEGPHPSRFIYKRPDGHTNDPAPATKSDGPLLPSQRRIPRGFFGG